MVAMRFLFTLTTALAVSKAASSSVATAAADSICGEQELLDHPVLCHYLQQADENPNDLAVHLYDSAKAQGWLVDLYSNKDTITTSPYRHVRRRQLQSSNNSLVVVDGQLPVVLAHGMGDSCFNSGMQHITERVSELLGGVYTTCIPTGSTQGEDTKNGYFLSMDKSVDAFAAGVAADPNLQGGFHAIGFSQGNNVIRGYIAKVNSPAVNTFISVNGVNAGIGAVPYCRPDLESDKQQLVGMSMCDLLMEQASRSAYTEFSQEHSFQANYWRDPRPSALVDYQKYSQLAVWNNEAGFVNQTLKDNWAKTEGFVWVLARDDGMIWPAQGEQWSAPDPADPFHTILPMKETEWYQQDLFGLKTADEAGKNKFESFAGDHLAFTEEDFERWVATYLSQGTTDSV